MHLRRGSVIALFMDFTNVRITNLAHSRLT